MLQDACSSPSPGQLIPPPPPVYTSVDGDNTGRAVWAPCTVRCEHPVHELRSCFFGSDKSTSFSWGAPCGPGDILCRCWVVAFSNFRWANLGTSLWTLRLRPHLSSIGNGRSAASGGVTQALEAEQPQLIVGGGGAPGREQETVGTLLAWGPGILRRGFCQAGPTELNRSSYY